MSAKPPPSQSAAAPPPAALPMSAANDRQPPIATNPTVGGAQNNKFDVGTPIPTSIGTMPHPVAPNSGMSSLTSNSSTSASININTRTVSKKRANDLICDDYDDDDDDEESPPKRPNFATKTDDDSIKSDINDERGWQKEEEKMTAMAAADNINIETEAGNLADNVPTVQGWQEAFANEIADELNIEGAPTSDVVEYVDVCRISGQQSSWITCSIHASSSVPFTKPWR